MYAMSGGSYRHAQVVGNLYFELRTALAGSGCSTTANDVRLRVSPDRYYAYPDLITVCGEVQFADDERDTVLNPALVIEVLSPSTERFDRGFKFARYRSIPSLQEYVLVSQSEPHVEVFRRAPGEWIMREFVGLDATCHLASVNQSIALAGIYRDIAFDDESGSVS